MVSTDVSYLHKFANIRKERNIQGLCEWPQILLNYKIKIKDRSELLILWYYVDFLFFDLTL